MGPLRQDSTKARLLATAERLFAEYGIEAVTPRQIALAASQLNSSAIRYHFGTKDDLIHALLANRICEVNQTRRQMFDQIVESGGSGDLRALLGAVVVPLAKRIERRPSGAYYVRFLAHLFADRRRRDKWIEQGEDGRLLRDICDAMRKLVPDLPDYLWAERLRAVLGGMIHGFAARERLRALGDPAWREMSAATFLENLIDTGLAVMTAPASRATLASISAQNTLANEERSNGTNG